MSDAFIGEIRALAFNYPPVDWAYCNGQSVPVMQYQALYAVIGVLYGGTPNQVFNLPDLRGQAAIGAGAPSSNWPGLPSNIAVGAKLGSEPVTLTSANLPTHTHQAVGATVSATSMTATPGSGTYVSRPAVANVATYNDWSTSAANTLMSPSMITVAGSSAAHDNLQPFLTFNFCIATYGNFPVPS
jgi:microcystin-dependent protein